MVLRSLASRAISRAFSMWGEHGSAPLGCRSYKGIASHGAFQGLPTHASFSFVSKSCEHCSSRSSVRSSFAYSSPWTGSRSFAAQAMPSSLSSLTPGKRKRHVRRARGGGDKQAGRGHKGQRSRSGTGKPALFFEGGQSPFWKRLPKRGHHNRFSYTYDNLLLTELDVAIRIGKIDPRQVITMKHLYDAELLEKKAYNRNGVVLLARPPSPGKARRLRRKLGYPLPTTFRIPIEIEVANVTAPAREAIESAGGKVHKVYYNKLGMLALLVPTWFAKKERLVPRAVQMVPYKKQWRYDRVGTIPAPDALALPPPA